jgi:parallel beta-helix repeat protein
MRRLLPGLVLLVSACVAQSPLPPSAPREISGRISGVVELSGEVLVSGDLLVPAGSMLIVRPGTTLRVRAAEGTKIDPEYLSPATEILVRGTLRILGTAADPVRLVPERASPEDVVWAGILFDGGSGSVVWSEIVAAESGILCIAAAPGLEHNILRRCRYGIIAQHGSAPAIVGNTLLDGEGGLFCWDRSSPLVRDNRITGHAEEGIVVDRSSRPLLKGNVVSGNDIGLLLGDCDLPHTAEQVRGNREEIRCLANGGGS